MHEEEVHWGKRIGGGGRRRRKGRRRLDNHNSAKPLCCMCPESEDICAPHDESVCGRGRRRTTETQGRRSILEDDRSGQETIPQPAQSRKQKEVTRKQDE
jgi:hypothetical protein